MKEYKIKIIKKEVWQIPPVPAYKETSTYHNRYVFTCGTRLVEVNPENFENAIAYNCRYWECGGDEKQVIKDEVGFTESEALGRAADWLMRP